MDGEETAYLPPSGTGLTDRTSYYLLYETVILDGPHADRPAILYELDRRNRYDVLKEGRKEGRKKKKEKERIRCTSTKFKPFQLTLASISTIAEPVPSLTVPKGPIDLHLWHTGNACSYYQNLMGINHDLENFPIWRARLQWNRYDLLKEEGKNTICNDEIVNLRLTLPSISTMAEPIPNPTVPKGPSTYKGVYHHRKVRYSSATYKGDNRYRELNNSD